MKYNLLNELVIREIKREDLDQVIQLIKKTYNNDYNEKYYYKRYLEKFINKSQNSALVFWKGAFLEEKLIAQMLITLKNGVGKLKLVMADPEFKSKGVTTYLGFHMEKILQLPEVKSTDFYICYSYAENHNLPAIKILENYQFKLFGRTPDYNKNSFYKIYGRVINLKGWKYITPHLSLGRFIQNFNTKYRLKRLISISIQTFSTSFKKLKIDFESKNQNKRKTIFFLVEGIRYAKIFEDNQSWYGFKFTNNPSSEIKFSILVKIIEIFENNKKLFSISLYIDTNDLYSQDFLLKKGYNFFAYLPFYHENDVILIGKTKTRDDIN
ncbi:MAG: hypothetical protein ACFFDH_20265 [Promethearchaeota archaeon]